VNDDEMNTMIQEITMGIPKEQSLVIRNDADAVAWDSLAAQIAEIKARGHEVEIPFETPTLEVVKPPTEEE
jgi:hypothetical protein